MMKQQRQTLIYIEEEKLMKKIYSMPMIKVSYFEVESIVTSSGDQGPAGEMTAEEQIKEQAGETSAFVTLKWVL